MTKQANLTFIGAGNMAKAILGGLIANQYPKASLTACAPAKDELAWIRDNFGIATHSNNNTALPETDVLVLCVKPQVMQEVCEVLREGVQTHRPLIISIAAGITSNQLETWLGGDLAIVRCMPNTPAQVHLGATGMFANTQVSDEQKDIASQLFEAVGMAIWVATEHDIHTVTALSGSGPAYCFMFIEAMENAAKTLGLPDTEARLLAIQTMRGAAELAKQSEDTPAELKRKVMSPGGTTERAIARFEQDQLPAIVKSALHDAWQRSYELAGEKAPD